jgi:pyruvate-formate lyase-activating enzyme
LLRVAVSPGCAPRCPSCDACPAEGREASLESVTKILGERELLLGGGDATRWRHLPALLRRHRAAPPEERPEIWIEAPARAFTPNALAALQAHGVRGVVVQIEAMADAMCRAGSVTMGPQAAPYPGALRAPSVSMGPQAAPYPSALRALGVGDGQRAIANAEALGLATEARLCVRPRAQGIIEPLGRALSPRPVWVELMSRGFRGEPVRLSAPDIEKAMLSSNNLAFTARRLSDRGHLPPCTMPELWRERPLAWRTTFRERDAPNTALPACAGCAIAKHCHWNEAPALSAETLASAAPIKDSALPWDRARPTTGPVPDVIVKKRTAPGVVCVTPWTTMEIVDPDGKVRQCCSTWTIGDRGNLHVDSLAAVWNGPGYRAARRAMAEKSLSSLCQPICSRLYDDKFSEKELRIQSGSDVFVKNQLLLAEEIAEKREVLSGKPLRIAVCPSTYCNYDCIMCDHGRSPRRELPESIWDELTTYLPTLSSLTLLGGEPLANPLAMRFLRAFDVAKVPDCSVDLVTNGSLLTDATLRHLRRATLGDVTVSLNAGTPEVYERVQRGIALKSVLANIDRLIELRRTHHRYFGITVSFVLQPAAAHTLIEFGEIARSRGLRVRLMALNPENHEGLDFYEDEGQVAAVIAHVDRFIEYCERVRPEWLSEVRAGRAAVLQEAAHRRRQALPDARRLPILQGQGA